ncbi:ArsR/SmtB family transcription factor [Arthrobacter globiformis]|uniref:ArsR/SmtB family transcription factor n=1 Tax=Arthrobacter globiformis TaxID=1665 RepID=UPI00277D3592|nr:helix-turn-helix domain-containing protein [Arthrobacter globiformis]MDQ0864591.1 DNA-binding transcriptional ArsR family regulator [Arthrobacter globiformis]
MPQMAESATKGRLLTHPKTEEIRIENVLHALSDPIRLRIVRDLERGHEDMACMAFGLPVSKSTSTHHFRVLRESGIIRQQYHGTSRVSQLRRDDLDSLFPGLLDAVLHAPNLTP